MKNVILLTIDALRKDALGCYGNGQGLTPFIDSLQSKCIRFTKAQACGPYTQASFPGLLTSSYFLDGGKPEGLSLQKTLISEPLKDARITTAGFHSNLYLSGLAGWDRGWDVFYDSIDDEVGDRIPYIKGDVINQKAANWLSSHLADHRPKPFFLWLHYMDVHEPYLPEQKYIDMVDPSLAVSPDEMFALFKTVLLKRDVSDLGKVQLLRRLYDVQVREVDRYVQEFFSCLQGFGLLESSVIILTSDHGDEFNEHGGLSHDDKMYSELIDVPLLIYHADRDAGELCQRPVSNIDIPPTILGLFGLGPEKGFEGHSLLPLAAYPHKGCYGEALYHEPGHGEDIHRDVYSYREDDLKIIYRANDDRWEMYDLQKDPLELNNIVDAAPEAARFKSKLLPRVRRWQKISS